jgi:Family of unknown function (DUF5675)
MNIDLTRKRFTNTSAISDLSIDGKFVCYVLEDVDRGLTQDMTLSQIESIKVFGLTAIPTGVYKIVTSMSPRFKRILPRLMNVPGFQGILIHPGNFPKDTHGCLLPGIQQSVNQVLNSRQAFDLIFPRIQAALEIKESVDIHIQRDLIAWAEFHHA